MLEPDLMSDHLARMAHDHEHIPTKVKITPEMVKAGTLAMATHDPDHFSWGEIVTSIYEAMDATKSKEGFAPRCPPPFLAES